MNFQLRYEHFAICNWKTFPFYFLFLKKILWVKMEEKDMQGHPTRISVQGLFLLLIFFHRVVLLFFGASHWLKNLEIFVHREYYLGILIPHLETGLVITQRLNIYWKIACSVDIIWIVWFCYFSIWVPSIEAILCGKFRSSHRRCSIEKRCS